MKKSNKIQLKKEIPSNPDVVFCDEVGNFNILKDNKYYLITKNGEIIKNNEKINEIFKIPYSTNIKCGTKTNKYLIILTHENNVLEYDLKEQILTTEHVNTYFKDVKTNIQNILFMGNYYYLFYDDQHVIIYDKSTEKIFESNNINKYFPNAPKTFSTLFINNNILYEKKSHGAPCFFKNKDLYIYDVLSNDTYYTNIDNGFISNTNYNVINYTKTKATFKTEKSGTYRIICIGAGLEGGGFGGYIFNDYKLKKDEKLEICVGGSGERIPLKDSLIVHDKLPYTSSSAGSGGSFVYMNKKLLMCAGGGGGWSSEIVRAPNLAHSCFSHPRIYNKIVIPIKKMVLKTNTTHYHKSNNIKQKLIIKDFKINSYNYNTIDYNVTEKPQNSKKNNLFETFYNNNNEDTSITFEFFQVLSDYDFLINCSVESTNNDKNNCDLYIYDEQNRELVIRDFNKKLNNIKISSKTIINLFVKYPNTLNNQNVVSGNKTSNKYEDLFENIGEDNLDYPLLKLDGGIGGGGFSYMDKNKVIINCGGGGGYKGGSYFGINEEANNNIRKHINLDYVCGIGGLSYVKDSKFNKNNYVNDYNNENGKVIIIEINKLQKLGKMQDDSFLETQPKIISTLNTLSNKSNKSKISLTNDNNNLSKYFLKNNNKDTKDFDINVPSLNRDVNFDIKNSRFNTLKDKVNFGVNYFKIKLNQNKYDKIKIYIECDNIIEVMLMYFSTKTFNRTIIKDNTLKRDNILSLNHGMVDPSMINVFSFLEKLINENIYSFSNNLNKSNNSNKSNSNKLNKKTSLFEMEDLIYNKSKSFIFDLNLNKLNDVDYLYILINSFKKGNIKINILQYNSKYKIMNNKDLEKQLRSI